MKTIFKISMVLLAAFAVTSCQPGGKEDAAGDETEEVKVFPVRVLEVQRDSITKTLDYTANLTAFKEIHYAPASPGRIDKVKIIGIPISGDKEKIKKDVKEILNRT